MPREPSQVMMCVRLPIDVSEAFRMACDERGVSQSEVVRSLVQQWLTGEIPMAAEGYTEGRKLGASLAIEAIKAAIAGLPDEI